MSAGIAVLGAFIRRDWRIDTSYRAVFAMTLITSILTLAIFFFLGKVIDDTEFAADAGIGGGYFGFVAIGIAIFTIVQSSMISFSRKLREEQTTGTFEALMTTPASPSLVILSSAAYEILRALVDAVLLIVVAVLVFDLRFDSSPEGIATALVALVGTLVLFASIGVGIGALTVIFKRAAGIVGLVMSVIALLSGVYFPIDVLPPLLESIAKLIPFTWSLDVLRASLLGGEVEGLQLVGLLVSAAVLLPSSLVGFRRAVARARLSGTLAEY